jgi:hypothetical protein
MSPKQVKTITRLVNHFPPRLPRVQSRHSCFRDSDFFSRFPARVISRISDFFHSGPMAGTVTISTGPAASSAFGVPPIAW